MPCHLMSGKALTVLGPVSPDQLGITLMHEHLLLDLTMYFHDPQTVNEKKIAREPVTLKNLGWVRKHVNQNLDNLRLLDENVAAKEAYLFKLSGGQTIVDATPIGLGRNPTALARIARKTGLNVVAGSGYYVHNVHPRKFAEKSVEEIKSEIVADILEGIGKSGVRAGIIGEIGNSYPLHRSEKKVDRAAARAQLETGAAIEIHPGRHPDAPEEIIRILKEEGANLERVIICHIDRTVEDLERLRTIAKYGCYLEYDMFGGFGYEFYPYSDFDVPNDLYRIRQIHTLIKEGYEDQVLLSHDIDCKIHLTKYGGFGFAHIVSDVVPRILAKGVSAEQVSKMLVENPKRVLTLERA